jgi:hypothetical protein
MAMQRRLVKGGAIVLVVGLLGVWAAGEALISRTHPAERYAGVILSPAADQVLRRACFDCHSNETRYPAYSYLPVASLLLANNVREGRRELNFSEWGRLTATDKADAIEDSLEQIQKGGMPTWDYVFLHPEARLTAADRTLLEQSARQAFGARPEQGKGGKREKGEREDKGKERR